MSELLLTLGIGVAGGVGALFRWLIIRWHGVLPFGLFVVNILAGGVIGYIYSLGLTSDVITILSIGLAGGLSTFAGIAKEAFEYYHRGRLAQMFLTLAINTLMPVLAMLLVMWGVRFGII
jgi:fluoride ion exporter CrcB/FEX